MRNENLAQRTVREIKAFTQEYNTRRPDYPFNLKVARIDPKKLTSEDYIMWGRVNSSDLSATQLNQLIEIFETYRGQIGRSEKSRLAFVEELANRLQAKLLATEGI